MGGCGSGQRPLSDFSEHGNEPTDSRRGGQFLDYLSEC